MKALCKKVILISSILLVFLFLSIDGCSSAKADIQYIATTNIWVRSEPSTQSDKLGRLQEGDIISVTGKYDSDWITIRYNNQKAYVSSLYVTKYDSNATRLCITATEVNLRKGPSKSTESIAKLKKGVLVIAYPSLDSWSKVIYNGETGYIKTKYLEQLSRENEKPLGAYTTSYSGSPKGRCFNIEFGGKKLNEIIVSSRETFSLLKVLGPINEEGGYHEAFEFKTTETGTETVKGFGGGVCQIATTLYQAVKASNDNATLDIKERHKHSKEVGYIEAGQDATISWNSGYDFCFKNKSGGDIKIVVSTKDNCISVAIVKIS